jgi:hypothetical protein
MKKQGVIDVRHIRPNIVPIVIEYFLQSYLEDFPLKRSSAIPARGVVIILGKERKYGEVNELEFEQHLLSKVEKENENKIPQEIDDETVVDMFPEPEEIEALQQILKEEAERKKLKDTDKLKGK